MAVLCDSFSSSRDSWCSLKSHLSMLGWYSTKLWTCSQVSMAYESLNIYASYFFYTLSEMDFKFDEVGLEPLILLTFWIMSLTPSICGFGFFAWISLTCLVCRKMWDASLRALFFWSPPRAVASSLELSLGADETGMKLVLLSSCIFVMKMFAFDEF